MSALESPIEYEPNRAENFHPSQGSGVKIPRNHEIQEAGVIVVLLCVDVTWHLGFYKHFPREIREALS